MSQVGLELIIAIGLTVVTVVSLVMSGVLIIGVSKFGKRKPTYMQLGQVLLVVALLCIIGLVMLYFFYPSYMLELIKQTLRIGG